MIQKYNIFHLEEKQKNIPICQYLSLDNFITHLTRKQYYVRRKKLFAYITEKTLPLKYLFLPTKAFSKKDKKTEITTQQLIKEQFEKFNKYKELSYCFTSCWTKNIKYNNFMWESYASKYGVCIISTIKNVIASINYTDFQDYEVYCAPVSYRHTTFCDSTDDLLFIKSPLFKNESEIRFLFFPKDKEKTKKENIWLNYNYNSSLKI